MTVTPCHDGEDKQLASVSFDLKQSLLRARKVPKHLDPTFSVYTFLLTLSLMLTGK